MKSIMISIKPEWVAKILNGEKTIEVRKTAPKCKLPIDVYIYCTKSDIKGARENFAFEEFNRLGRVVAKFTLRKIEEISNREDNDDEGFLIYETSLDMDGLLKASCLDYKALEKYLLDGKGYAWHISDLVIFDKPSELGNFGLTKAPESFCYIEN